MKGAEDQRESSTVPGKMIYHIPTPWCQKGLGLWGQNCGGAVTQMEGITNYFFTRRIYKHLATAVCLVDLALKSSKPRELLDWFGSVFVILAYNKYFLMGKGIVIGISVC